MTPRASGYPSAGSCCASARSTAVSSWTAETGPCAVAVKCQWCGGTSHDQPSTSPGPRVCTTAGPRPGNDVSSATWPARISQQPDASCPSSNNRAPEPNLTSRAAPATAARWAAVSPSNSAKPESRSARVIGTILPSPHAVFSLRGVPQLGQPPDLGGDVDPCRAPGDAAPAADAAGATELVVPGAELVRDPLPVPALPRYADAATVQVGEVRFEARSPALRALCDFTGEVGGVLGAGAKTGWADHGAISARQAAAGDIGPVRRFPAFAQQRGDVPGRHLPSHTGGGSRNSGTGVVDLGARRGPAGERRQYSPALVAADIHDEAVPGLVDSLGEGQIVAGAGRGPGAHRRAEAHSTGLGAAGRDHEQGMPPAEPSSRPPGPGRGAGAHRRAEPRSPGLGAAGRDHEQALPSADERSVRVRSAAEDGAELRDRGQVARAHAQEGITDGLFPCG